jgi:hypothetical protein
MNFSHIQKFKILGCDKITPLKGISPRDSHSRKGRRSKNGENGIRVNEDCTIHWGVLSFCRNHLVYASSSKILPGSRRNRVGTSIGRWVGCRCLIGVRVRFGVHMSIMALPSTIETPSLNWMLQGIWSCLQPLHIMVALGWGR